VGVGVRVRHSLKLRVFGALREGTDLSEALKVLGLFGVAHEGSLGNKKEGS
jgi:hypothetical protein